MVFNKDLKRFLLTILITWISGYCLHAQVAVNSTSAGVGSISDFNAEDKGILIPRVNIIDLSTIAPITGGSTESLLVYNTNTTTGKGYYYWDGSDWIIFATGGGGGDDDWKLLGNAISDANINFIGTTDNQPLVSRTAGTEYMRLLTDGSLGLNTNSTGDGSILDVDNTTKAVLIPRVDISNLATIAPITGGSTEGLLVYNTNGSTGSGFHYWNGTQWVRIGTNILGGNDWSTTGNAGTDILTNFLGTIDDQDYIFRTNGVERMRLTYEIATGDARLGVGTNNPNETLDVNGDVELGGGSIRSDNQGENIYIRPDANTWYISVDNDATVAGSEFFINEDAEPNTKSIGIDPTNGNVAIGHLKSNTEFIPEDILHIVTQKFNGNANNWDRHKLAILLNNGNSTGTGIVHSALELWAGANKKAYFQHKNVEDVLEIGNNTLSGNMDFYVETTKIMNINSTSVEITGDLTQTGDVHKAGGTFKIDHPLDPENKYLYHSFVESPDMMNVYDGIVITDKNGEATVQLPSYFNALNRDFQYQFTTIGSFSKVMVSEEISNSSFVIKSQKPNTKVSWQVTGIRQDPYANKYRVIPEVEKETNKKGTFLYSEVTNNTEKKESTLINTESQK